MEEFKIINRFELWLANSFTVEKHINVKKTKNVYIFFIWNLDTFIQKMLLNLIFKITK